MMRLYGPEIAVDPARLHDLRTRAIEARNEDDAPRGWSPDSQVQIRLCDGTWKPASRIAPGDAIAVSGKVPNANP